MLLGQNSRKTEEECRKLTPGYGTVYSTAQSLQATRHPLESRSDGLTDRVDVNTSRCQGLKAQGEWKV